MVPSLPYISLLCLQQLSAHRMIRMAAAAAAARQEHKLLAWCTCCATAAMCVARAKADRYSAPEAKLHVRRPGWM